MNGIMMKDKGKLTWYDCNLAAANDIDGATQPNEQIMNEHIARGLLNDKEWGYAMYSHIWKSNSGTNYNGTYYGYFYWNGAWISNLSYGTNETKHCYLIHGSVF